MRWTLICILSLMLLMIACGGPATVLKLGDCPLTINVKADGEDFDGYANVYINGKLIGTTAPDTKQLKISLKPGEYVLWVTSSGFLPWKGKVLLLGKQYEQTVLARLRKEPYQDMEEQLVE